MNERRTYVWGLVKVLKKGRAGKLTPAPATPASEAVSEGALVQVLVFSILDEVVKAYKSKRNNIEESLR